MALYRKLRSLLFDAGLSETEVFLYLELLKKPSQNLWEIIKRTGLKKSTVYDAFSKLKKLQMVEKTEQGIRALSLKGLVSELNVTRRKVDKTAFKIKQISPFLRAPRETIEEFETFYTPEQIRDIYLFMSEIPYDVNLDFGDYENFITTIADNELGFKFRANRAKHASQHGIITTFGPNTAEFMSRESMAKYKNNFEIVKNINFNNRWIIFSDTNDYVLFSDVTDREYPVSVLVKSKTIADMQRMQFKAFSEKLD